MATLNKLVRWFLRHRHRWVNVRTFLDRANYHWQGGHPRLMGQECACGAKRLVRPGGHHTPNPWSWPWVEGRKWLASG